MTEQYTSVDLQKWLIEKAQNATPNYARRIITYNDQRSRDDTIVGKMYFFKYDPKGKAYLLKYDKFPMCFPIEMYNNGFLGVNLHYLSAGDRQGIIDTFMKFKNNKYTDERARLRLSYDLIASAKSLNSVMKPCVKRYLFNQVRSKFIEIYPEEYNKAIQLSVEEWVLKG